MNNQQKISIIELFAGIGAQVAALKRLGVDYKVVGISEIDKYAIQSYNAINGPTFNYGDITKIPMLDYADLWTYSFPCQDLSVAGKQAGINEGTRSGLLLHVERLLETAVLLGNQPKYLLLENVKALVSKKFKPDFDRWLQKLESLGYNNYWQVLNAKDYGVPQNRERVFVVSIRKDVDTKGYKFPEKIPLIRRLKDVLEVEVPERYYLSDRIIKSFLEKNDRDAKKGNGFKFEPQTKEDVAHSILAGYASVKPCSTFIQEAIALDEQNSCIRIDETVGTLTTDGSSPKHNNRVIEPNVLVPKRTEYGKQIRKDYERGIVKESRHNMTKLEPRNDGIANTLTTVEKDNFLIEPKIIQSSHGFNKGNVYKNAPTVTSSGYESNNFVNHNYRIRKLTPLECWRLMDFTDDEFYAAQLSGVSNSQLYKQSGNSICVCVCCKPSSRSC